MVKCILDFYQYDEYSQCCPGKQEFVSVTIEDLKCHKQKCLLLINLNKLHLEFLNTTDHKIGFSKFYQLCPKWCVTVNSSSGIHSVCVCTIHKNAKLLHGAIPGKTNYKKFLSKFVCNTSNQDCIGALEMHRMSSDDYYTEINSENQRSLQYEDIEVFKPGMYAACIYDNKWYRVILHQMV